MPAVNCQPVNSWWHIGLGQLNTTVDLFKWSICLFHIKLKIKISFL